MQFRILGSIEVRRDGEVVSLGGPKVRAVLAMLLLHANEAVSRERLIEGLWGDDPPPTASHTLDDYVSRLRRALGDGRLARVAPGYRLAVERDDGFELDLDEFDALVATARRALASEDTRAALAALVPALALWRGPALADLRDEPFARADAQLLEERRVQALELRFDAELAAGRSTEILGDLEALVREHPYRERLVEQLVLALYRSGRAADALAAMRAARLRLSADLGLDPGPQLSELERAVLNHDPSLRSPRTAPRHSRRRSVALAVAIVGMALTAVALTVTTGRARHAQSTAAPHITAAYVTDALGFHDHFWNDEAKIALRRMHDELGIAVDVRVSHRDGDYVPNLTASARSSSIVFVPGDMIGPLAAVAPSFRDTTFVLLDRSRRDVPGVPPNVIGVTFREEQGSYAAGYLVARFLKDLHLRRPLLGSVGGIPIPPVRRFIDGFSAGAAHGFPETTMLVDYTQTFGHPERCRRAALRQIAAGAAAIFAVAGNCSAGVFNAAWRTDVWVIGVDSVRRAARGYTLATVLKRYDVAVASTLRAAVTGRLAPGKDVTLGLRSGGIALAAVNPEVPRRIVSATRSLSDAIAYASP